jgi:hypothetical protein
MFPYAIERNPDGKWTFINREYNPVGVVAPAFDYDDPRFKVAANLTPEMLKKLDQKGTGEGDRIHLYNDGTNPIAGGELLKAYLEKLAILIML